MLSPDFFPCTIEVDLDGVLADFDDHASKLLGKKFAKFDNAIWGELMKHPTFFRDIPLTPDAMVLWTYLTEKFPGRVQILTAIPRDKTFPLAELQKREWVAHHFGEDIVVKTGPHAVHKQDHCSGRPNHILIDDNVKNIAQWGYKGGVGIFHLNAESTISCLEWFREVNPNLFGGSPNGNTGSGGKNSG